MNNKEIKKLYYEKIKLLKKSNKFYFDKNDPIISDREYEVSPKKTNQIKDSKSIESR